MGNRGIVKYWFSDDGRKRLSFHNIDLFNFLKWDTPICFKCCKILISDKHYKPGLILNWTHWNVLQKTKQAHIIPLNLGGSDHESNMIIVCERCDKSIIEENKANKYIRTCWMNSIEYYFKNHKGHFLSLIKNSRDKKYTRKHYEEIIEMMKEDISDSEIKTILPTTLADLYGYPRGVYQVITRLELAIARHYSQGDYDDR